LRVTIDWSQIVTFILGSIGASAIALLVMQSAVYADGSGDPTPASQADGEYRDRAGNPTFKVAPDGTVDWYTSVGFVRYTANCMQCHGPDGLGSSFAPSLVDSMMSHTYSDFISTVANGKKDVNAAQQLVMPSFGTNPNVMCYIDPIYVYLRARADGAVGRGRPTKSDPRPAAFTQAEDSCMQ
jgi:methanol metabolism-related c-type cytochrome